MAQRLLRWVGFSLIFALVPLMTVLVVRWLADKLSIQALQENLSEVLFFALTLSVTSIGDLAKVRPPGAVGLLLNGLLWFFGAATIASSILYGFFHFDLLVVTNLPTLPHRLMWLSLGIAGVVCLASIVTQVFLAKVIGREE